MDVDKMSELRNGAATEPVLKQYLQQKRETQGSHGGSATRGCESGQLNQGVAAAEEL